MINLIPYLAIIAACPTPVIINKTELVWNKHDQQVLKRLEKTNFCKRGMPQKPCVETIVKTNYQNYFIICGKSYGFSDGN